eukprot:CAMPEP_0182526954 /NCGR_PEP_ID=MMETSP1323-20130603/3550_1 /TAXON_ID=236787 /ORGANISM="Florenciella parvula, Strain RCC1693" /LENGTH=34 /DNA_ID= /DNA_START= /DNA_END= /DNA_ORIENTATION=
MSHQAPPPLENPPHFMYGLPRPPGLFPTVSMNDA